MHPPCILALEDGTVFHGEALGPTATRTGEVVFNTAMCGYQEVLYDPSYAGQIVCMTYPLIGNYGVHDDDRESRRSFVRGFVVREAARLPSSSRQVGTLESCLEAEDVPGIEGIDTRALVRRIRKEGSMRGAISSEIQDPDELVDMARAAPPMEGTDLVREVTCGAPYRWRREPAKGETGELLLSEHPDWEPDRHRVVVYDFGVKWNILRLLRSHGFDPLVVPAATPADEVLALDPEAVMLSNGPGDPAPLEGPAQAVRELAEKLPIFGICLGHQVLGLAFGGDTYKLKFGHRGANHPVRDESTGKVEITSQNHGFAVDPDSLADQPLEVTHWNLNDQTVEGLQHRDLNVFSVQYHPEASPGPHDSAYLFERFRKRVEATK